MTHILAAVPTALPCRACCQPLKVEVWPGRDFSIVTCVNPDCVMHQHTLTTIDYPTIDLPKYNATEHPRWADLMNGTATK